ncbi:MAG: hypothetical protein ACYTGX_15545 [Planctomycetota bacterium]|jgi:hypothetical protein
MRTHWMIALACLCSGPAGAQDAAPDAATTAAKPAAKQEEQEGPKPFKLENFELFERRNPFSPTPEKKPRKPVKPAVKKPDPKPEKKRDIRDEVSKNLTLTAILIPRDGGKVPLAIVEEAGKDPKQLREGDAFLKGKVTAVSMDGITVLIDGTPRVIKMGEAFADGTKTHKVYADTGERVDGSDKPAENAGSTGTSGSESKKAGGVSSLLSDEERNLPDAERKKLLLKRLRERAKKQRGK